MPVPFPPPMPTGRPRDEQRPLHRPDGLAPVSPCPWGHGVGYGTREEAQAVADKASARVRVVPCHLDQWHLSVDLSGER